MKDWLPQVYFAAVIIEIGILLLGLFGIVQQFWKKDDSGDSNDPGGDHQ